jgi:acrylyl-CoA reductase (NADPH)
MPFKAFRIHNESGRIVSRFETLNLDDLNPGEVVIRVEYSDINYKDALAATGAGKILRKHPLVGGIDLAGVVESSSDARYKAGDPVLVTGSGLSETHDGGYTETARVSAEWVIPMPKGLDSRTAMALGTAGFTAALAIHRMEHNGLEPGKGPVAVTGATGGVGSIAIDMLAARGYEVHAITGKADAKDYLTRLGAAKVLVRGELELGTRPLEATRFAGAVDNVGGDFFSWLARSLEPWGSLASIGLTGGADVKMTVMPFILRGVNVLGINSAATPRNVRLKVWERIAGDLKPRHLDQIVTRTIGFDELPTAFDGYLKGDVTGRTLVKIGGR